MITHLVKKKRKEKEKEKKKRERNDCNFGNFRPI
jgi:hypothetical protein